MKGKVTDENAETIIGATVSVKGANYWYNHRYQWSVFHQSALWKHSSLFIREHLWKEKRHGERNDESKCLVMKEDAVSLEDVVVVGYGVQKGKCNRCRIYGQSGGYREQTYY